MKYKVLGMESDEELLLCGNIPLKVPGGRTDTDRVELYRRPDETEPTHIHFNASREYARRMWGAIKRRVPPLVRSASFGW